MQTRRLADVPPAELRSLLAEESRHWGELLLWDFRDVASAVATGLERKSLEGRVAHDGARPVSYCYFMQEAGRTIVGSLFAASEFRGLGIEEALLEAVLADAQAAPARRVECQTLFSTAPGADRGFRSRGFHGRTRHYMVRALRGPRPMPSTGFRLRGVRRSDLPAIATLIHRSHVGSVDAALNITYQVPSLCQGFVETLVLRDGCGRFDVEASFIADGPTGPRGVVLASRLSHRNGHICQVSVAPEAQGHGLGMALMTAALDGQARGGLETASLSVTVDNRSAYHLYERLGFKLRKEFMAYAWVRPPGRLELPA